MSFEDLREEVSIEIDNPYFKPIHLIFHTKICLPVMASSSIDIKLMKTCSGGHLVIAGERAATYTFHVCRFLLGLSF